MIPKGSKLYSILFLKCPRCHEGELFENRNAYNFRDMLKMKSDCPSCGLHYEIETGFFYGAMYVSYGLSIAFGVAILVAYYLFTLVTGLGFDFTDYLITVAIILILLMPMLYRWSRAVWMSMFIPYKGSSKIKAK